MIEYEIQDINLNKKCVTKVRDIVALRLFSLLIITVIKIAIKNLLPRLKNYSRDDYLEKIKFFSKDITVGTEFFFFFCFLSQRDFNVYYKHIASYLCTKINAPF